ncbi:MAG: MFS transporter [Clostridiales bacterium]|nr:MFS transporter [Clostridiales bacterium]
MKKNDSMKKLHGLRPVLMLMITQGFSALGSAMTSFALIIWAYGQTGSALNTALLSVCSYVPYILMSIFAGALSDRWDKKKTMLACDAMAAGTTLCILLLLGSGRLKIGHLYVINAVNGLMNTVQRPAADVAITLITPKELYQQASAARSMTNSVVDLLSPVLATALLAGVGLQAVIAVDLCTFALAFVSLALLIPIPKAHKREEKTPVLRLAGEGLRFLRDHAGVLHLILLFAGINLIASMYNAALPAMVLSVPGGGERALAAVSTVTGVATLLGGVLAAIMPRPKSRIRAIVFSLLLSMSTENFCLAFGRSLPVWCLGAVLGWIAIPYMNANLDPVMRTSIPVEMQGRVYACRNALQFFTIPLGYFLGGVLVDRVFEPLMAAKSSGLLTALFGSGKGSGASMLFALIGIGGVAVVGLFALDREIWKLDKE